MGNLSKENLSEAPLVEIMYFPEEYTLTKDIKRGMIVKTATMSGITPRTLFFVADNIKKILDYVESGAFFEGYIPGCKLIKLEDLPKSKQDFLLGETTEE